MTQTAGRALNASGSMLPDTAALLTQGGDARIALDPVSGTNRYGCRPVPDPELLDFASATASFISPGAFDAADRLRVHLSEALRHAAPSTVYADVLARLRTELLKLCGLEDTQPQMLFAPSGTDLHCLAAQRMLARSPQPLRVISVEENETGSGVLRTLHSMHPSPETVTVALRLPDGTPRPAHEIDAEFSSLTHQAQAAGCQVLLIQTDISKSGLIAPSYACSTDLKRTYGARLEVMIDACQFRLAPDTLRACLAHGYSIALTGSKFVGGPSFSGVLLIPSEENETPAAPLDATPNFGLVLRWEAALYELRAFRSVPEAVITDLLHRFARVVQDRLNRDPAFIPIVTPPLQRSTLGLKQNWDCIQTVFPFLLRQPGGFGWKTLDTDQTTQVYKALPHASTRCQLAQPIHCTNDYSALRLCLSARQIVQASKPDGIAHLLDQAQRVLDQAAKLAALVNLPSR